MRKTIYFFALLCILIYQAGCEDSTSDHSDEFLIRVEDKIVTALDFNNAFEIVKTAYSPDSKENPEDLLKAKLRLLHQMAVELLILKRAEDLGIEISEAEFEKKVADIKADYPEGTFEETLLEYAVSYESWEKRLKTRLIMDKVIETDLYEQITISPEDIAKYYDEHYQALESNLSENEDSQNINEIIILRLRRQKAEQAYKAWVNKLKKQHLIEINSDLWEEMTGMKGISLDAMDAEPPPDNR